MNYIREINSFYDWLEINSVSDSAIVLWHALMHINNRAGWLPEFTVAISTLSTKTGLKKDAIIRARLRLQQMGRIDFRSRSGQQSAVYRIIPFESVLQTQNATQVSSVGLTDANCNTNRDTNRAQTATQTASIIKLNETKQNEKKNTLSAPEPQNFLSLINELGIKCRGVRDIEELESYLGVLEPELIREALKRSEKKSAAYALRILKDWNEDKIHSLQRLRELESISRKSKTTGSRNNVVMMDKLPASVEWQREQEKLGQLSEKGKRISDDPELSQMLKNMRAKRAGV
ncbi:DnaD domain protein [Brevibacillus choshinensis]|uniref:DnaD domain protein n=1 Tax=Brevibacillus choshinensis TaxID=54911 RepID=UPI002E21DD6E|nr:DnaD domain protein [Brevibacillus choshinensis]